MKEYEVMFIVSPELTEDSLEKVTSRISKVIVKTNGTVASLEDLGTKSLAYKINKKSQGHYFLCRFNGPGGLVAELERNLRLDESVLRFMVIQLDKKALEKRAAKEEKKKAKDKEAVQPAKEQEEVTE